MLGISLVVRYFSIVTVLIPTFLLGFLLLGCASSESAYLLVYLLQLQFDNPSNASHLSVAALRANYMASCAILDESMLCLSSTNNTILDLVAFVDAEDSTLKLSLLAEAVHNVCHPRLLTATIVMCLVLLVLVLYTSLPLVPGKVAIRRASLVVAFLTLLLWALGAMLQHQTVVAAQNFIETTSFEYVTVKKGGRADAMTWTALSFMLLSMLCITFGAWRDVRQRLSEKV